MISDGSIFHRRADLDHGVEVVWLGVLVPYSKRRDLPELVAFQPARPDGGGG